MRRILLASLPVLLVLAPLASAAAPPPPLRTADQLDYLFLGSDRPVLLRLHVRVGGEAYGEAWAEFMDKLFAWFDRDNDGSLSPAEVARLPMPFALNTIIQGSFGANNQTVPFAAIDTNKDGKVSKDEFRAYYRANGFSPLTFLMQNSQAAQAKQINDAIIKRLDRKGDGTLTAAKVAGLYDKLRSLDENEDEIITQAELNTKGDGIVNIGGSIYRPPTPPVVGDNSLQQIQPGQEDALIKSLVAKYDRDKDGKLSRPEIGLSEADFARLDTDKDGFLSPAELTAYVTAGKPDLVVRLQLGNPPPAKGLLGRLDLGPLIPLNPRVLLVNDKTIDPALKKKYRRGPGDACTMSLGDTRLSIQVPHAAGKGGLSRANNLKAYYLQLFTQAAGKKDHVTRDDLKDPNYQILLSIYSQADKNADGKLTRIEVLDWFGFLATAGGIGLTLTCNDLGRSLFDILDADGDGRLSLREMRSAWARLGPLAKDGALSPNDLPRAMRLDVHTGSGQSFVSPPFAFAMGAPPTRVVNRRGTPVWFDKMDRNNDGDISPREWLGTDEEFKAIDADGDGLISAAEAIAFEAKKKEKS